MFKLLKVLIDKYSIEKLEEHCFHLFFNENRVDDSGSEIFLKYFKGFELDESLSIQLKKLNLNKFENLETVMELLIPTEDRAINGAFFTPSYIVDYIINEISPDKKEKVLDPSCGCGAFILGAIRYFQLKYDLTIKQSLNNIYGSDILPYNIRRTKLLVSALGLLNNETIKDSDFNLINTDSLRHNWDFKYDYIIGNPPYVKYQDLSDTNREFLLDNFDSINKGTFNLYFAFFELGFKLLKENGKLGYITPNNYFTSLSGESLRLFFDDTNALYKIIDFNHFKIFNAQTYTCISFLSNSKNSMIQFDKLFSNNPVEFLNDLTFSNVKYEELNPKKWRLLRDSERYNIKKIETIGIPIKELFIINVGIATLKDAHFIVDPKNGKYCKQVGDELVEIEVDILKSLFKMSTFKNQDDIDKNLKKIIFPYSIKNGKAELISEETLIRNFPNTWKYLNSIRAELETRGKVKVEPFYKYGRSQGLNKFGLRILTPTFSQYPKFLIVSEFDSLYCNGYGLHYKEDFKKMSLFDNNVIQLKENIDVLQRILNSKVMDYYVKNTSVSIQGGYPCYQKNFIEKFSIPKLTVDQVSYLRTLTENEFNHKLESYYDVKLVDPNLPL